MNTGDLVRKAQQEDLVRANREYTVQRTAMDEHTKGESESEMDAWLSRLSSRLGTRIDAIRGWDGNIAIATIDGVVFGAVPYLDEFGGSGYTIKGLTKNGYGQEFWADCGDHLSSIGRWLPSTDKREYQVATARADEECRRAKEVAYDKLMQSKEWAEAWKHLT